MSAPTASYTLSGITITIATLHNGGYSWSITGGMTARGSAISPNQALAAVANAISSSANFTF
jgi:hypothetical protein